MNTAIAPSTMPASTAPPPSDAQALVDHAGRRRACRARAAPPTCPAAASAPSICPVAHAAMFGMIASTTAGAVRLRHRLERLRADHEADVEQDRQDRRDRQDRAEQREQPEEAEQRRSATPVASE